MRVAQETHFGTPLARARDALRFAGGDLPSLDSLGSRFFSYSIRASTDHEGPV